jgi:FecR protein
VSILQPIGRQRGSLARLLLITLFWISGCQSLATQAGEADGSDTRWKITEQAGPVSLRTPGQSFWHRAIPGAILIPGSEVATFDGTRLELTSADDKVTASGPSRFTLPKSERNGVRVRQDAGSLSYEVQSAPKRRFEVKTPHFSTVVKGTRFLVSVDRTGSEVFVDEGPGFDTRSRWSPRSRIDRRTGCPDGRAPRRDP